MSAESSRLRAIRVYETAVGPRGRIAEIDAAELTPGEVRVRVRRSGVNYKDALAVTGRGKILRRLPLNVGIDLAGTVERSSDPRFRVGDAVLANGMGLGEERDGGLAELVEVPADALIAMPPGLDFDRAMALGTAGFTAAQALARLEQNGQSADGGPLVVTGASGGVGSIAVALAAKLGYRVIAVSGRRQHHETLTGLGAAEVRTPEELELGSRALESARFGGAIDNVGGALLAGLVRHLAPWGNVAVIGNAGGAELETTVYPMILRGVSLLGISSTNCPMPLRRELWARLGADWQPPGLERIVARTIDLEEVPEECAALVERRSHGRTVVRCSEQDA